MDRKRQCFVIGLSLIFLVSTLNLSLIDYAHHRLLEITGAALFEEQVRKGDLLPEKLINEVCNNDKIRFLTIGGRIAVGESLEKNQTYPYLLCNGDRIAGINLKPGDVAPCLKKIIGDNVYDMIVLDLFPDADESLLTLTRRLVNRFPNATILNMRQFFPGQVGFQHRQGWASVSEWAKVSGYESMTEGALKLFKESDRPWTVRLNKEKLNYYDKNNKENFIWSFFKDTNDKFDIEGDYWKETLLRRAWMFSDWYEPNEYGHKDIARGVLEMALFNKTETKRSDETNPWDDDDGVC